MTYLLKEIKQKAKAELVVYSIYFNPKDYPKRFVVRPFVVKSGSRRPLPKEPWYIGNSLDKARESIPIGLSMIFRSPDDPPSLIESWM